MTKPYSTSERVEHLDSLRGLAASAVLIHHCLVQFRGPDQLGINSFLGRGSVLFFFVLSGFVLGKSLQKQAADTLPTYIAYVCRRILRLYPAILITLLLFIGIHTLKPPMDPNFSSMLYGWHRCVTTGRDWKWFAGEFTLLHFELCPVKWSLRVEFICSLLLPPIVALTHKSSRRTIIVLAISAGLLAPEFFAVFSNYQPLGHFLGPFKFFFPFFIGYLISKTADLKNLIKHDCSVWILLLGGPTLISISTRSFGDLPVVIVLALALTSVVRCNIQWLKRLLLSGPLCFIGRCSYSVYLLHMSGLFCGLWIIQMCLPAYALHPDVSTALLLTLLTLVISLPLATTMERLIETPFNKWGRQLSDKITT